MRVKAVVLAAVVLSGCTTGYWPKVEGDAGAKYQADVRECQTEMQGEAKRDSVGSVLLAGGMFDPARDSAEGRAFIDSCMKKQGYTIKPSG